MISAPAQAQDRSPAERQALLDLSRIMGESHAIRQTCEGPQDGYWYTRMKHLLDVEAADQGLKRRLANAFSAGFNQTKALYPQCVDAARAEAKRIARTAQGLSEKLAGP
jgi:uncharacterized protein (TIGR02301 family)